MEKRGDFREKSEKALSLKESIHNILIVMERERLRERAGMRKGKGMEGQRISSGTWGVQGSWFLTDSYYVNLCGYQHCFLLIIQLWKELH